MKPVSLLFVYGLIFKSVASNDAFKLINVHPMFGELWEGHEDARNAFPNMRLGAWKETPEQRARRPTIRHQIGNGDLPEEFDARDKWGKTLFTGCKSITTIRDQSKCGSCWSFGATEAMSDRLCIHSNFLFNELVSPKHLLSCCHSCGFGCKGGYPSNAWDYWVNNGILTDKCQPYPFHCGGPDDPCPPDEYETPDCTDVCDNPEYNIEEEWTRGNRSYNVPAEEEQIMMELMTNGPMEVTFTVYEDFMTYHKGVYFHGWGELLGGHAVRLVGWGKFDGKPFWTLANSWKESWGENGYFRILRGFNECEIESGVVAGMPDIPSLKIINT